jgi:hypothetical protein
MKWIVIFLIFLYGTINQQFYFSSAQQKAEDKRIFRLQTFFTQKKSPLAESAKDFVEIADQFGLDWKLLPAISGVESGFETNGNVTDYNPFGYMCGAHPCRFNSYRQALIKVAGTITRGKAYFRFQRSGEIYELAQVYNGGDKEKWQRNVEYFRKEVEKWNS